MGALRIAPLSILSWGGIGDTIRNLSLVPHQEIYRRTGMKSRVVYKHWTRTHFNVSTGPPDPAWFQDLISRCPSLCWSGEVEEYGGTGRVLNLALRLAIRVWHRGPRYFPFALTLSAAESARLSKRSGRMRLAIQTHLSGMKTKHWGKENWKMFIAGLLAERTEMEIFLFDSDDAVADLQIDQRVQTTLGFSIPQSIVFLQSCDLLVSIDSWSKYIAAAYNIPQVLVIPDQRAEYPQLTPEKLLREELAGIYGRADTEIIGISAGPPPQLTLRTLADLTADELLQRTKLQLGARR